MTDKFKVRNVDGDEIRIFHFCVDNEKNMKFLGINKDNEIIRGDFSDIMREYKFVEFLEYKDFKK